MSTEFTFAPEPRKRRSNPNKVAATPFKQGKEKTARQTQRPAIADATEDDKPIGLAQASGERQQEMRHLTELLGRGTIENILLRHQQSTRIQKALDKLLDSLDLPAARVTPGHTIRGKKSKSQCDFVLNVQSAAAATMLRNQIPQLQLRLRPHLGKDLAQLTLRVRTRPAITAMRFRTSSRLEIPPRARVRLEQTAKNLGSTHLRSALLRLLQL